MVKRFYNKTFVAYAILLVLLMGVACVNFLLVWRHTSTGTAEKSDASNNDASPQHAIGMDHPTSVKQKLASPIFVVGLPKVGTTSIYKMFQCSGVSASHYCCCGSNRTHTHCNEKEGGKTMAACMKNNLRQGQTILEGCGSYELYAQMDAESGRGIFLPQRFHLDELHRYAPNATFILNLRPPDDWVNSVSNWFGLGGRFLNRFKIDPHNIERHKVLKEIYNNHTSFIRNFTSVHTTHKLVEVNIALPDAGKILADAFGLDESCWGVHNKNKKIAEAGSA